MNKISDFIIPAITVVIVLFGAFKGLNIFSLFLTGAKKGFEIVLGIAPSLIGLMLAINMLTSSGALSVLESLLAPLCNVFGIPEKLLPLTILSPVSGSGSLGFFENILKSDGPDSFIGRCASVMMGSTETTFYTMTMYYGCVDVKKTRHTLPCALCADFTSFILSPRIIKLFFKN